MVGLTGYVFILGVMLILNYHWDAIFAPCVFVEKSIDEELDDLFAK